MGSLYIHIPFCKQACRYCDFYFTVSLQYQDPFTNALLRELELRPPTLKGQTLKSLYFGGGTPSLLSLENMEKILQQLHRQYGIDSSTEMTMEVNPDDLLPERVMEYRKMGWNRLSIGIQSFRQEDLNLMRRSHDAPAALRSIEEGRKAGFDNISIDLIYGIPGQDKTTWESNLEQALKLEVDHLSAYHLSFEEGTVFDHWRKKGKIKAVEDSESEGFYSLLRERTAVAGFEHYEISNFAREGKRSRHNQVYWSGENYMGFGPSAHSYSGKSRHWNPSSLKKYMEDLDKGKIPSEGEKLSPEDRYHDYLITSLRTSSGASKTYIEESFGKKISMYFEEQASLFLRQGSMLRQGTRWVIDPGHWIRADHIVRELFL